MTIYDFLPKFIKKIIADKPRFTVTHEYWNELFNMLIEQGDHSQEAIKAVIEQLKTNVLFKDNTEEWEPTGEYEPVTRKFVTDRIVEMGGGNMMSEIYDPDNDGVVSDADKLDGQSPAYYAKTSDIAVLSGQISAALSNLSIHTSADATASVKGHVVIEDNLLRSAYAAGKVLSSHQGYVVNDKITKVINGTTPVSKATNATNSDKIDGLHLWVGPLANKGTDANTIYFCY